VRTTIDVNEPLLDDAKRLAAERQVTLSTLVEDALRAFLNSRVAPEKRTRFRLHTVRGRLVRPDLDLDRTSALVVEDDETAYGGPRS
jgi:hypothetical protein